MSFVNLRELEQMAKLKVDNMIFEYYRSGGNEEITKDDNVYFLILLRLTLSKESIQILVYQQMQLRSIQKQPFQDIKLHFLQAQPPLQCRRWLIQKEKIYQHQQPNSIIFLLFYQHYQHPHLKKWPLMVDYNSSNYTFKKIDH